MVPKLKPLALKHEIFILDANLVKLLNESTYKQDTKRLVDDLLKTLEMEPLGPLQVLMALDQRAPGWSFIQPITTSHISGHYFEKPGRFPHLHLDIYSCCSFQWQLVINKLDFHLGLKDWSANFITRHTKLDQRKIISLSGTGSKIRKLK